MAGLMNFFHSLAVLFIAAFLLAPILFITKKLLTDYVIESQIFRTAIYAVLVPFFYIMVIQDITPGPLVEGIILVGMAISFWQILRGIVICLKVPENGFYPRRSSRFSPVMLIISWLLIIIFNLYTMVLLISNTDPYSFVDDTGPVTEPLRLLYFTVVTFTGVGYGDITPRGSFAVFIAIVISITGFLYSALFIGGILAAFTRNNGKGL